MAKGKLAWYKAIWYKIDETLRSISRTLKKIVRTLRFVRAFLATGILIVFASIVAAFILPEWMPLFYAISMLFLVIPLVMLLALIQLPLMAKSVVRLIDKGYPDNARELAIRLAARKLHEQSIETEELLLDTAINEARKAKDYYARKAKQLQAQLDALDEDEGTAPAAHGQPPASRCMATTQSGDRCRRAARPGTRFCAQHEQDDQN